MGTPNDPTGLQMAMEAMELNRALERQAYEMQLATYRNAFEVLSTALPGAMIQPQTFIRIAAKIIDAIETFEASIPTKPTS